MKAKLSNKIIPTLIPQAQPYEVVDTELKGFLLRVQPSGVMTYYLAYRSSDGKKKRYKIGKHGTVSSMQAREVALTLSGRVIGGEDVQERKKQIRQAAENSKSRTLEGFLNSRYQDWVIAERKTGQATVKRIKSSFKEFMTRPLDEINHWIVEKWRVEQLKAGKKPATVNRDITSLKALLSKAIEWEVLELHPLAKLKPIKTDRNSKVRYLTSEEENQLRDALIARDARMKREREHANQWRKERGYELYPDLAQQYYADYLEPMVLLAINTGMRRGELFDLLWDDVNFSARILTVSGSVAKSGKTRHIPLNKEAWNILQKWCQQCRIKSLVFSGRNGERFSHIQKSWSGVLIDAGITDFRFHDLRHHFASKLVMSAVDLNTVRELLGHGDIQMTLRYAHLAPEHKARAVEKLVGLVA
jgi:integrase